MNHLKVLFILSYFDNEFFDSKDTIIHINTDYLLSDDKDFKCKIVGNKVMSYKKINYDKIFCSIPSPSINYSSSYWLIFINVPNSFK